MRSIFNWQRHQHTSKPMELVAKDTEIKAFLFYSPTFTHTKTKNKIIKAIQVENNSMFNKTSTSEQYFDIHQCVFHYWYSDLFLPCLPISGLQVERYVRIKSRNTNPKQQRLNSWTIEKKVSSSWLLSSKIVFWNSL